MVYRLLAQKLSEFDSLLRLLTDSEYSTPCESLSYASIGEHVRHVLEMLQCLESGYDSGRIDYNCRKRSIDLQTRNHIASQSIQYLISSLDRPNCDLVLLHQHEGDQAEIGTNYERELLYNLEHAVHHQALIKVALRDMKHVQVNENFGVAQSTIEYRNQCAR